VLISHAQEVGVVRAGAVVGMAIDGGEHANNSAAYYVGAPQYTTYREGMEIQAAINETGGTDVCLTPA
jgi:hypothetical protein